MASGRYAKRNGANPGGDALRYFHPDTFFDGQTSRPANNNDPFRSNPRPSKPFGKKPLPSPGVGGPVKDALGKVRELERQGWHLSHFVGGAGLAAGVYFLWKYVDGYLGHERRPDPRIFRRVEVCPDPLYPTHTHMGWNNQDAGNLICIDGQSTSGVWPSLTTLPDWVTSLTLWDVYDQGGIDRGHMMEHWVRTRLNNQVNPAGGYAWTWVQGMPDHMPNPNGQRNSPSPDPLPGDAYPLPLPLPGGAGNEDPNFFPDPVPNGFPASGGTAMRTGLRIDGDRKQQIRPRRSRKRKIREKERKVRGASGVGRMLKYLDFASEAAEWVDAFYEALPKHVRHKWEEKLGFHWAKVGGKWKWLPPRELERGMLDTFGQYGIDGADWKGRALYHNWRKVDVDQAIRNIIKNELQDKALGAMQRGLPVQSGQVFDDAQIEFNKWLEKAFNYVGL